MTDDDPTRISGRRRPAEATRPSKRRVADADARSANPGGDGDATLPATRETGRGAATDRDPARGGPDALAPPPPGVDARPAHRGRFGEHPHHYYPRSGRTHAAASAGAWPESRGPVDDLFGPAARPRVLGPEERAARDERLRRRRTGRIAAVAVGGGVMLAAAAAALLVLL